MAEPNNFVNLEEITNRLGVKFRNISVHELLDQLHEVDPYSNPTIPGRKGQNINAEDTALAENWQMNLLQMRMKSEWIGQPS